MPPMLRHIAWFNEAPIEPLPEGGLTSSAPDVCRRCLAPAREIEKLGVACSVFGNLHDADPVQVGQHLQQLNTDIVVIGCISGPSRLKLARAAKHLGCYVVADIDAEEPGDDLARLLQVADQVVAATPERAAALLAQTDLHAIVIPDCDEKGFGGHSPAAVAKLWLECFRQLKLKPPASANSNSPQN
ncbi:MAG TPA: hypothetical protein VMV79_04825 [Alphaproteobacteria bacterium]|nr:hypothetical protein [Alphaproteobacteria bacterium]